MSNFIFWLEHLSLEETIALLYYTAIALMVVGITVGVWIDRKFGEGDGDGDRTS